MQSERNVGLVVRAAALAGMLAGGLVLAGCGMPGAPQPPSLNLPNRVRDLSAVRSGDQVTLTWTMPTRNTDKTEIKNQIAARVCRNRSPSAPCSAVTTLQFDPAADAVFTDTLTSPLNAGAPTRLTYFVELVNRKGRSAGLSNDADILAGAAPPEIAALNAELRPGGVLLSWASAPPGAQPVAVRIERKLLTPPAQKTAQGPLAEPAEPLEQTLLVEPGDHIDRAFDTHIRFGETYEYRAQRVDRVTVDGNNFELPSALSPPVRIDAVDIFPPSVPMGLAAVATPAENGAGPAIDLNWLPDTSADLAGYIVYRREIGAEGQSAWARISPPQPSVGPAYHDANVLPGRTYSYAVTAIGQNHHESARSAEAQETVPAQ